LSALFPSIDFAFALFFKKQEIYRHVLHSSNVPLAEYHVYIVVMFRVDQTLVAALVGRHAKQKKSD